MYNAVIDPRPLIANYFANKLKYGQDYLFIDPTTDHYDQLNRQRSTIINAVVMDAITKKMSELKPPIPAKLRTQWAKEIYHSIPALHHADESKVINQILSSLQGSSMFVHPYISELNVGLLGLLVHAPKKDFKPTKMLEEKSSSAKYSAGPNSSPPTSP